MQARDEEIAAVSNSRIFAGTPDASMMDDDDAADLRERLAVR